jgi:hypothetical protein
MSNPNKSYLDFIFVFLGLKSSLPSTKTCNVAAAAPAALAAPAAGAAAAVAAAAAFPSQKQSDCYE